MKIKIKKAILSLSDKSNLEPLVRCLKKNKIQVISSGKTEKKLNTMNFHSINVSLYTGSDEILGGRVKTLHPKIHGGILSVRNNKKHSKDLENNHYDEIDLVIVNFYPFEKNINIKKKTTNLIESIDIGGPALVRAAAKNFKFVTVITDINDYPKLIDELNKNSGFTTLKFREHLATKAFQETSFYESNISNWFNNKNEIKFPHKKTFHAKFSKALRYGENPHQRGVIYSTDENQKLVQFQGKKLSYNNYNDLYAALRILKSFPKNNGTVIVKHGNPCGASIENNLTKSFQKTFNCDPRSAFGGIVGINSKLTKKIAAEIKKKFFEIIIFNKSTNDALKILKEKKKLILMDFGNFDFNNKTTFTDLDNIMLAQDIDEKKCDEKKFIIVSKKKPNKKQIATLKFAFNICKFVKSNAIVIAKERSVIGVGAGQTSRFDSCQIAIDKAKTFTHAINGSVAASDAFFPFTDGIEKLASCGVTSIIQPGGSIRDKEIIKKVNDLKMSMVFTGTRHFKH